MKLTLQMQVLPTADQKVVLLETMERFNAAASLAAKAGFEAGVHSQPSIHKRCYADIRERFGLSSQMAVRAIGKAVEAFATLRAKGREECPGFRPRGAVTYDERILSFKGLDKVSLWTLAGRMVLPLAYGEYQGERLGRLKGQVDLIYRDGRFFLYATVDMPEDAPIEVKNFLGIDLGIVDLARDSDGGKHTGEAVEKVRRRHHRNRMRAQRKGTKGAKKRLGRLARREARFRRHENHVISKQLVAMAKGTDRGIGLEDLSGIRERTTVKAGQRARHSGWAFFQLRSFVAYKAKQAGVPVVLVDPRNTSRTCSACGHCEKANRKTRDQFECRQCGHSEDADLNAARNIAFRAWAAYKPAPELVVDEAKTGLRDCG
jgi:IS605 OrfB family transposase